MSRLTIATRGSALALWQANHVAATLKRRDPELEVELLVVKTKGDKILDVPLAKVGGKALFVKEIEQALLDRAADVAVHSMKDVPVGLAEGLVLAAVSSREDPRDALCGYPSIDALPPSARVGTSSLRRQCQLLARRPDLQILPLRGNVPTRLAKLDAGEYDAVVLAAAGLIRLGHGERISGYLEMDVSLPAVGQGVLGIETRGDDEQTIARVESALHDTRVALMVTAERTFSEVLGGGCQTPIAAHAVVTGAELSIDGLVGRPDGTEIIRGQRRGPASEAVALARELADELGSRGAHEIIEECIATYLGPGA